MVNSVGKGANHQQQGWAESSSRHPSPKQPQHICSRYCSFATYTAYWPPGHNPCS